MAFAFLVFSGLTVFGLFGIFVESYFFGGSEDE